MDTGSFALFRLGETATGIDIAADLNAVSF